jgi:hypothetical protein
MEPEASRMSRREGGFDSAAPRLWVENGVQVKRTATKPAAAAKRVRLMGISSKLVFEKILSHPAGALPRPQRAGRGLG